MAARSRYHITTPVFDGASSEDLWDTVKEAGMDSDARAFFTLDVQVSQQPTSLSVSCTWSSFTTWLMINSMPVQSDHTQWLLNNHSERSQFGGQRFEMECGPTWKGLWCIKNVLQVLTYKSDDVNGRLKAYEAITKRPKPIPKPGVPKNPSAFLSKNLQSLDATTCVSWTKMIKKWNFVTSMRKGRRWCEFMRMAWKHMKSSQGSKSSLWCWRIRKEIISKNSCPVKRKMLTGWFDNRYRHKEVERISFLPHLSCIKWNKYENKEG